MSESDYPKVQKMIGKLSPEEYAKAMVTQERYLALGDCVHKPEGVGMLKSRSPVKEESHVGSPAKRLKKI